MFAFMKPKPTGTTPFSEFIRNASSAEKKKVYTEVIQRATERQKRQMAAAGCPSLTSKKSAAG